MLIVEKSPMSNANDEYIIFLKIFEELLRSSPSVKAKNSKIENVKSEMFKTSRDFNAHVSQK